MTNRKTAFVGLGNRDRGDDAAGLRFIDDLRHLNPYYFFSEEQGLESIILEIIKNEDVENVVFVDACSLDGGPGEIALVQLDSIGETISTHKIPLSMLMALIQTEGKKAYLIGIQPESLEFETDISETVEKALERIEDIVGKMLRV
ncbi:MAG TPA: hydrogenase maturation protease [Thermoplasmata archaeon]|nr:hydrogenase maturation protease [Thermoplasmata archaeon]